VLKGVLTGKRGSSVWPQEEKTAVPFKHTHFFLNSLGKEGETYKRGVSSGVVGAPANRLGLYRRKVATYNLLAVAISGR